MDYWSVNLCVCLGSTQVSVCFPLCSLNLGPQSSLSPWTHSVLPRTPPPIPRPHTCGPGGAGACSPEDRGSAGSQKHLSVPLPLCPRAPGTALNSAAGASECVFKERRRESGPPRCLNEADARRVLCRARMSVFQPAPKHTGVSLTANSWPFSTRRLHHDILSPANASESPLPSSPNPTQPNPHPHTKTLTWLNVSFTPDRQRALPAPAPLSCMFGNTHVACS